MSTLATLALLTTIVTAVWVLLLRPTSKEEQDNTPVDDQRVSPLLRGIQHLLSDKPELALQDMVEVAKLRSESTEVYMALGEMFLSQGEIGRAVRIHQNILARPHVPQDLYIQAHFALAKDFQTGGLLDRALRHYQKVLDVQSDHLDALRASLRIRELSHEWQEAESLLSRVERIQDTNVSLHRAYLWAEMSEQCLQKKDITQARQYAEQSLNISEHCTHAYLVMVTIELHEKNIPSVLANIHRMQSMSADFLHLLVPILYPKYSELLMQCWQESHHHELGLTWLERLAEEETRNPIENDIQLTPKYLRESLRLAALGQEGDDPLIEHAKIWRKQMKRYHCKYCGVDVVEMYWQCPQCHIWGSSVLSQEDNGFKELT